MAMQVLSDYSERETLINDENMYNKQKHVTTKRTTDGTNVGMAREYKYIHTYIYYLLSVQLYIS